MTLTCRQVHDSGHIETARRLSGAQPFGTHALGTQPEGTLAVRGLCRWHCVCPARVEWFPTALRCSYCVCGLSSRKVKSSAKAGPWVTHLPSEYSKAVALHHFCPGSSSRKNPFSGNCVQIKLAGPWQRCRVEAK